MRKKYLESLAAAVARIRPRPSDPTWDYAEAILQWERFRDAIAGTWENFPRTGFLLFLGHSGRSGRFEPVRAHGYLVTVSLQTRNARTAAKMASATTY
jgi:hypothetical protein